MMDMLLDLASERMYTFLALSSICCIAEAELFPSFSPPLF